MGQWLRFFFGTPQRFMTTAVVIGGIIVLVNPGLLGRAVNGLVQELWPVNVIVLVFCGIRILLGGRRK